MKYLSLCSGIEAVSVAWQKLGFKAVGFSEVEPFPNAILSYHYPDVPNLGDMTKIKKGDLDEQPEIIVGGTPCQSFSVAGYRKGMDDDRGNLTVVFARLLQSIRPRWFVWENVPGVLSSNDGHDFATILSLFTGKEITKQRFTNAGIVAGSGQNGTYSVAYRILDAKYFGIPQRRRRVFVVGYLGTDWRPPVATLFEQESLSWHFKASEGTGQSATAGIKKNIGKTSKIMTYNEQQFGSFQLSSVSNTIKAGTGTYSNGTSTLLTYEHHPSDSRIKETIKSPTITKKWGDGGNNCGVLVKLPTYGIQDNIINRKTENGGNGKGYSLEQSGTLTATDKHAVACDVVRRLTPVECERLQGFPDNYTQIPWRGKDAGECPLSHRYKAIGNSMAVPVVHWIGKRLSYVNGII